MIEWLYLFFSDEGIFLYWDAINMFLNQSKLDILSAYSILFDSSIDFSTTYLNALQPDELKTAFRKKALATHPDRSTTLGLAESELQVRFQEVSKAYEVLKFYVTKKKEKPLANPVNRAGVRKAENFARKKNCERKWKEDHFFQGKLPDRRLKIGQFLYYSKIISWQTLIDAIVWQKKQRPLFGQIAKDWGYLTSEDVVRIISQKSYQDRFGDYALRNGYLTSFQQMAIAGRQRICQPLIGSHFIRKGIVTEFQLKTLSEQVQSHNMKYWNLRDQR
ncbi:MAG: hypothetical protein C0403_18840 [Desulfobacterium sp.]|nr:hypothetical protein [Desulfobacterium sp.]